MNSGKGAFFVIEGTDGAGKTTQFALLHERLLQEGYDVATFDFPRYDQPSSYFVTQYLNGLYGSADQVGPYTASLFYALDRYEAAPQIRDALAAGKVVIANRFTGSSMGHQGTKFANPEERRGFFIWLDNLEFEMLQIPRPDMSVVLRVPADIAQHMVDKKETRRYTTKKRDLHEADLGHLERALAVYDDLTQLFPKDFSRIDCVRSGTLLSVAAVQELLWQKIMPLLPEKPTPGPAAAAASVAAPPVTVLPTPTPSPAEPAVVEATPVTPAPGYDPANPDAQYHYFTPDSLTDALKRQYQTHLTAIFELHSQMVQGITSYVASLNTSRAAKAEGWEQLAHAQALAATQDVLPLATTADLTTPAPLNSAIQDLAQQYLPNQLAAETTSMRLTGVWPRNEIDLLPDMLYEHSNLPLTVLREAVATWPYGRKLSVLEAYVRDMPTKNNTLQKAHYNWDVLCEYSVFRELQAQPATENLVRQPLTPRYGYDVPALVEEAGLSDEYERCFDISLSLYSALQQAGFAQEAQLVTLLGHKTRCTVSCNGLQAFSLLAADANRSPAYQALIEQLHQALGQSHPLISEALYAASAATPVDKPLPHTVQ